MEIAEIQHWMVRAPFSIPVEWGSGTRLGTTRLVCRIRTACGAEGWGETQCLIDSTPAVFTKAAEMAKGWDIRNVEGFHRYVLGAGYYHHARAAVYAIAALEMAMWDAFGRALGQPLWALWGGKWRDEVRATGYVFLRSLRRRGGNCGFIRIAGTPPSRSRSAWIPPATSP